MERARTHARTHAHEYNICSFVVVVFAMKIRTQLRSPVFQPLRTDTHTEKLLEDSTYADVATWNYFS